MTFSYRITADEWDGYHITGPRLTLRPARADMHDGHFVAKWRNSASARAAFFSATVVTPDSHVAWLKAKSPYDLVWLAVANDGHLPVGMAGLIVEPHTCTGEAGRYFVDPAQRGCGMAQEIDRLVLAYGFELLGLTSLWLDAWAANAAVLALHRKVGWREVGIDWPGHRRAEGHVVHMALTRVEWQLAYDCA